MRLGLAGCLLVAALPAVGARADEPPARGDLPRWRLRATLGQGFGGGRADDGTVAARFPTLLELGVRLWGPLSLDGGAMGTLAGEDPTGCGRGARPNAVSGLVGVRADLANGRGASWLDPWIEAHASGGVQAAAQARAGQCPVTAAFAGAGARAGFDAWLGRGAVTMALQLDYLPVGSALSVMLGASLIAY